MWIVWMLKAEERVSNASGVAITCRVEDCLAVLPRLLPVRCQLSLTTFQ